MKQAVSTDAEMDNIISSFNIMTTGPLKEVKEDWLREILGYRWNSLARAPETEIKIENSAEDVCKMLYIDSQTDVVYMEIEVKKDKLEMYLNDNISSCMNAPEQKEFTSTLGILLTDFFEDPKCYKS